jgi:rhodanese-related sulfurtransferase
MDGEISGDELEALLTADHDGDAPRIVDIRNPEAYARRHIPGSENIPAPELTDRVEELDDAGRVVTVCPHGKASVQAARLLGSYEGVEGPVESLACGLVGWEGPLASADETDTNTTDEGPAPF